MGACVYIYSDVRIGQEGFGFASTTDGFLSVPQRGRVVLEDDVEVRANAKIDRGSRETRIGAGCRLDNLVQIGKCYSQPMLRHRRTGRRVQPYLKISSAGAGRRQWPGIFGSVKARRSADGGQHFGCGSRREGAWQPRAAKKRFLPTNRNAQEDDKERTNTACMQDEHGEHRTCAFGLAPTSRKSRILKSAPAPSASRQGLQV